MGCDTWEIICVLTASIKLSSCRHLLCVILLSTRAVFYWMLTHRLSLSSPGHCWQFFIGNGIKSIHVECFLLCIEWSHFPIIIGSQWPGVRRRCRQTLSTTGLRHQAKQRLISSWKCLVPWPVVDVVDRRCRRTDTHSDRKRQENRWCCRGCCHRLSFLLSRCVSHRQDPFNHVLVKTQEERKKRVLTRLWLKESWRCSG